VPFLLLHALSLILFRPDFYVFKGTRSLQYFGSWKYFGSNAGQFNSVQFSPCKCDNN